MAGGANGGCSYGVNKLESTRHELAVLAADGIQCGSPVPGLPMPRV